MVDPVCPPSDYSKDCDSFWEFMNTQQYAETGFPEFPEYAPRAKENEFFRSQGHFSGNSAFFDITEMNKYAQSYSAAGAWDQTLYETPYTLPAADLQLYLRARVLPRCEQCLPSTTK